MVNTRAACADFHNVYEHREYPKWKYHATEAARIVHDPAAEDALGEGWTESPADHAAEAAPAVTVMTVTPDEAPRKKTRKG